MLLRTLSSPFKRIRLDAPGEDEILREQEATIYFEATMDDELPKTRYYARLFRKWGNENARQYFRWKSDEGALGKAFVDNPEVAITYYNLLDSFVLETGPVLSADLYGQRPGYFLMAACYSVSTKFHSNNITIKKEVAFLRLWLAQKLGEPWRRSMSMTLGEYERVLVTGRHVVHSDAWEYFKEFARRRRGLEVDEEASFLDQTERFVKAHFMVCWRASLVFVMVYWSLHQDLGPVRWVTGRLGLSDDDIVQMVCENWE